MNDNFMNEGYNLDELLKQAASGNPFGGAFDLGEPQSPPDETEPEYEESETEPEEDTDEYMDEEEESEDVGQDSQTTFSAAPVQTNHEQQPAAPTEKAAAKTKDAPVPSASELLSGAVAEAKSKQIQISSKPLFDRLPQFAFSGAKEDINPNKTFDEVRKDKATDFPQLDDAGAVTWSVSYGSVNKSVSDPKKTVIGKLKREIENSKEFLEYLQKGKTPEDLRCVIRPNVRGKSKGRAGYKGIFCTEMEALADPDKVICLIPSRSGKLYEMRKTPVGVCTTLSIEDHDLEEVKVGFYPAFPPIPFSLFWQIVSFFRFCLGVRQGEEHEALVLIYWDTKEERYHAVVPKQRVSKVSVEAEVPEELVNNDRFILFADCHSHNTMPAKFSGKDDRDERDDHVYMVVGNLNYAFPNVSVRVCNGGTFLPLFPGHIIADFPETAAGLLAEPMQAQLQSREFPEEWKAQVEFTAPPSQECMPQKPVFLKRFGQSRIRRTFRNEIQR